MACHHGNPSTTPTSRLRVALVAVLAFMCVEVAAGLWTGSLALLADAGHMLSDAGALAIALAAARLAQRP
ncbi:MAG: cation transporter, partial [Myxococcota bacterium]|nr:cation transporter [Myxococcota bacterium]